MAKNNTWHANQIHASFLLAEMDETLAINACHFLWLDKFHESAEALEKKEKKKNKVLDCMKLEYHKETWFQVILSITSFFLITQIPGQ